MKERASYRNVISDITGILDKREGRDYTQVGVT